ncbi:MAG TPA: Crp/Fnr family transcriptional regulator [Pyrinomonadaceae bacterium]
MLESHSPNKNSNNRSLAGDSKANKILRAVPQAEFDRIDSKLHPVALKYGKTVYLPEQEIEHVYFVTEGVVSLLASLEAGATVEAGVIGSEGIVGFPVVLGANSTPHQALVQGAGTAMKMPANELKVEFKRGGMLHDLILQYTNKLFIQVAQTAACNRVHKVEERLARWLLLMHDRTQGDEFTLTQEFISRMLGVRRAGVSVAASGLRKERLIDYRRGVVTILNRKGLEGAACECYRTAKK